MKKTITLVVDGDTTIPHLLNGTDFEIISTAKEDVWCMVKREPIMVTVSTVKDSTGIDR